MKLTNKEKLVLDYLKKAWEEFLKLDRQHPDEARDFDDGIHRCQYLMGMRIARKYHPEIFPIKKLKKCCAGCMVFTGGEIKHHEDCPYYKKAVFKKGKKLLEGLK